VLGVEGVEEFTWKQVEKNTVKANQKQSNLEREP
jgi:hypothetical protein